MFNPPTYLIEVRKADTLKEIVKTVVVLNSIDLEPTFLGLVNAHNKVTKTNPKVILRVIRQVSEGDPAGLVAPADAPVPIHEVRWK